MPPKRCDLIGHKAGVDANHAIFQVFRHAEHTAQVTRICLDHEDSGEGWLVPVFEDQPRWTHLAEHRVHGASP